MSDPNLIIRFDLTGIRTASAGSPLGRVVEDEFNRLQDWCDKMRRAVAVTDSAVDGLAIASLRDVTLTGSGSILILPSSSRKYSVIGLIAIGRDVSGVVTYPIVTLGKTAGASEIMLDANGSLLGLGSVGDSVTRLVTGKSRTVNIGEYVYLGLSTPAVASKYVVDIKLLGVEA